jgi:hypothetical protein
MYGPIMLRLDSNILLRLDVGSACIQVIHLASKNFSLNEAYSLKMIFTQTTVERISFRLYFVSVNCCQILSYKRIVLKYLQNCSIMGLHFVSDHNLLSETKI